MATPQRPGWYPAPDGNGEQWWNGASWSESRQGVGGAALPGLPGYQAAPPASPAAPPSIPAATVGTPAARTLNASMSLPMIAFVLGMLGIFVFPLIGVGGIVVGMMALQRQTTIGSQRKFALGGIITGVVAIVIGIVQIALYLFWGFQVL